MAPVAAVAGEDGFSDGRSALPIHPPPLNACLIPWLWGSGVKTDPQTPCARKQTWAARCTPQGHPAP
jgi:hypothetical protein